jgi:predicted nucleic acid-binding protein
MSQTSTTRLENRDDRVFSTPIALAFVRTVMERRGVTEAEARKRYHDYLNRTPRAKSPAPSVDA